MRILIASLLLLALTSGCTKPTAQVEPLDDARDLAAVVDGDNHVMYVREGWADTLVALLVAKKEGGEGRFSADFGGAGVSFTVVPVKAPQVYSPDWSDDIDSLRPGAAIWKIYFNAECGQTHLGFVAPCMATFGPHRAFGNSMTWTVNAWKSCTRGKSFCIESWKPIGVITYYPGPNCADTMFVTRPIMEFRCK